MRTVAALMLFTLEALAMGQGFNRRYDYQQQGNGQDGLNVERNSSGFLIHTTGSDLDSLSPDSFLTHASIVLTQIDPNGMLLWEKRAYRPGHSAFAGWANCCDTIPGGGYVVGGSSEAIDGSDEVYLIRFDALGDTLWSRVFGDPSLVHYWGGYQVKRTVDGGFAIVGGTAQNGSTDGFVIRTDSSGNEQWRETYGGSLIDYFVAVDKAADGYFLGGVKFLSMDNSQLWVQRIDTVGSILWSTDWGGDFEEPNAHLVTLADGHIAVFSAWGYALDFTLTRPYMAKLDSSDGSIIWEREYGPQASNTVLFAGKEVPGGDLIACGMSYMMGERQGLLLRTTSGGDSLWMRTYFYQDTVMNDGTGRFWDVLPTDDGGFIAAGVAYQSASQGYPEGYTQDTWVVKVDSMGCIVPGCDGTGVTELVTNLLGAITLSPNPAHGEVQVRLDLPANLKHGALELSLVGMDGRVVRRVPWAGNGNSTMSVDVSDLSAAMYTLHVTDGTKWLTGTKLIIE